MADEDDIREELPDPWLEMCRGQIRAYLVAQGVEHGAIDQAAGIMNVHDVILLRGGTGARFEDHILQVGGGAIRGGEADDLHAGLAGVGGQKLLARLEILGGDDFSPGRQAGRHALGHSVQGGFLLCRSEGRFSREGVRDAGGERPRVHVRPLLPEGGDDVHAQGVADARPGIRQVRLGLGPPKLGEAGGQEGGNQE